MTSGADAGAGGVVEIEGFASVASAFSVSSFTPIKDKSESKLDFGFGDEMGSSILAMLSPERFDGLSATALSSAAFRSEGAGSGALTATVGGGVSAADCDGGAAGVAAGTAGVSSLPPVIQSQSESDSEPESGLASAGGGEGSSIRSSPSSGEASGI